MKSYSQTLKTVYFIFYLMMSVSFYSQGQVVIDKVGLVQRGKASYYPDNRNNATTRSGEGYDMTDFTAAHQALAFNSLVKVTNLDNGKEVVVRINDRPYTRDRILDLTLAAANAIGLTGQLSTDVKLEVIGLDASAKRAWKENFKLGVVSQESLLARFPPPSPKSLEKKIASQTLVPAGFSVKNFEEVGTYTLDGRPIQASGYAVQVGAYGDVKSALQTSGFFNNQLQFRNVFIQSGWTDGKKAYRVLIGLFNTQEAALSLKNLLVASGYNAIVRAHYD